MCDIETLGWTEDEKFFVVRVNHEVVIWEDDIRGVCGIYNCDKFAGKYCGCRFVEKFALVNGNDVYVSAPVIDQEYCIDDPFIKITLAEFKELKGQGDGMNAAVVTPVMDWNKYTIDGWLEQFGAWCETVRMKGGDLPDGLHINQIYWLMREAGKEVPKGKAYIRCEINDFEADQVQALLRSIFKSESVDYQAKYAVMCLVKHKVENRSLSAVAGITNQSKAQVNIMVGCARFFLHAHDKRLRIS